MREDTFMMRELATQTRLNPDAKISKISRFIGLFNEYKISFIKLDFLKLIVLFFFSNFRHEKVKAEFNKWQMKFDSKPVKVEGRVFPKEILVFGNVRINI
jgi:hypothetical protein